MTWFYSWNYKQGSSQINVHLGRNRFGQVYRMNSDCAESRVLLKIMLGAWVHGLTLALSCYTDEMIGERCDVHFLIR